MAEVGQRVCILPEHAEAIGLPAYIPFTIAELDPKHRGDGDDGFVRVSDDRGRVHRRWVRTKETTAAPTTLPANKLPLHGQKTIKETNMSATPQLISLAAALRKENPHLSEIDSYREAGRRRLDLSGDGRRAEIVGEEPATDKLTQVRQEVEAELARRAAEMNLTGAADAVSLSARPNETFDTFVARVQSERGISWRQAVHLCGVARPDLAEAR